MNEKQMSVSRISKSCNQKLENDPIQSSSEQTQRLKRPKSMKSQQEQMNWKNLTQQQKLQFKEQVSKNFGLEKQIKKENNKIVMQNDQRDDSKKFADQIIYSEEVSVIEQLTDSNHQNGSVNQRFQNDRIKQGTNKKSYFNLMLIGAASTGKTTYMECLLKQYKQKANDKIIKQHTQKVTQIKSQTMSSNLSLDFYVIDTPGYKHSTIGDYCKLIQNQIKNRIQNYKSQRKSAMTQSSVYQKQQRQIRDERIHCCLFFFRGPRLHSDDWRLMEQLHNKCNIIPIISKGDSYTTDQILQLKKDILLKAKERQINWFNIQQYIRQKHPQQLHLLEKGPFGPSPPFMIVSSTNQIETQRDIKVGRQFKWGTCYIQDPKHTQFSILNKLIIKYLRQGFVKMTDVKQDKQKNMIQKGQKTLDKVKKGLGYCMILAAIGVLTYKLRPDPNQIKK